MSRAEEQLAQVARLAEMEAELRSQLDELSQSAGVPRAAATGGASASEQQRLENMVKALQEDMKKKAMRTELD